MKKPRLRPLAAAIAPLLPAVALAQVNELCDGSPTASCGDVTPDGIRYTGGVDAVNVADGVPGATVAGSHTKTHAISLKLSVPF